MQLRWSRSLFASGVCAAFPVLGEENYRALKAVLQLKQQSYSGWISLWMNDLPPFLMWAVPTGFEYCTDKGSGNAWDKSAYSVKGWMTEPQILTVSKAKKFQWPLLGERTNKQHFPYGNMISIFLWFPNTQIFQDDISWIIYYFEVYITWKKSSASRTVHFITLWNYHLNVFVFFFLTALTITNGNSILNKQSTLGNLTAGKVWLWNPYSDCR